MILRPSNFRGSTSKIDDDLNAWLEPDGLRLTIGIDAPSIDVIAHVILLGQGLVDRTKRIDEQSQRSKR